MDKMLSRRSTLALMTSAAALPRFAMASQPRETWWEDLIPPGVPYSEIIGEGDMDVVNDTWNPIYDANGVKLNETLNGAYIKMPGFAVPLVFSGESVVEFLLVPYMGACIHTPPPPPNQLVYVTAKTPWVMGDPWDAIWVTGQMKTQIQTTDLGEAGYFIEADSMELYEW